MIKDRASFIPKKMVFLGHKVIAIFATTKLRLCALGLGIAPIDRSRESEWPSVGKSPLGQSVAEKNAKNVFLFSPIKNDLFGGNIPRV